jgi:hypothetical protein
MSPLEPIDPLLESPLSHPILKQKAVACELINEVRLLNPEKKICILNLCEICLQVQQANTACGGMLLANMERQGQI